MGRAQFDINRCLLVDKNGAQISLRQQSMAVLECLAHNRNNLVTKDELIGLVWPGTFVTDDSLVQCIREIRQVIGDIDRQIIETLVKRGYRLNVGTKAFSNDNLLEIPRAVVLGFQGSDLNPDTIAMGHLVANGLISELSHFGEFSVVSRHSSTQFRNAEVGLADIASQLNAQYAIEGEHRQSQGKVHVSVRLIKTEVQSSIWTHTFVADLSDQMDIHTQLITPIAASVGYRIREHAPSLKDPESMNAMLMFLNSGADVQMPSLEVIERAIEINTAAIELEPKSPYGYIGLSFAYLSRYLDRLGSNDPRDDVMMAVEQADKALSLSPHNSQAHFAGGEAHLAADHLEQAEVRLKRSLELNPHAPHVLASMACLNLFKGDNVLGIEFIDRAIGLDPERPDWFLALKSAILRQAGQFEAALEAFQRMATIPGSNHMNLAAILVGLGRQSEAEASMAKFLVRTPDHTVCRERAAVENKFKKPEHMNAWLDLIGKAGLPD